MIMDGYQKSEFKIIYMSVYGGGERQNVITGIRTDIAWIDYGLID
jgi:hypothetical protein